MRSVLVRVVTPACRLSYRARTPKGVGIVGWWVYSEQISYDHTSKV